MDKDMSASSPPPKAPTSPSLADHPSDSNNQPSLVDPSKTKSGVDTEHSDTGSAGTSPGDTAANVLEEPDEDAAARSNKRARTDLPDEEDSLPSPKRVSKRSTPDLDYAGMTAPADADDGPETATNDSEDNASVVAKPKKQPQKSRKAPTKKTTAKAGRSRACATCKRRKVKCTHNTANEDTTIEEGGVSKPPAPAPAEPAPEDDTAAHDMPTEDQPPKKTNARKRPAPKAPTAPPTRVSKRSRRSPPQPEDPQPTAPPKRTSTRPSRPPLQPTPTPTKKPARRVFDPTYITTNSTSRLAKADLYHLLTDDASAWTCLTPSQQTTLISMLPSSPENQRLLEKISNGETQHTPPRYLSKGDVFRTEVAKFKEDLRNGHLAKTWQRDARVAVEERAQGVFDGWKGREAEAWWGQKSGS